MDPTSTSYYHHPACCPSLLVDLPSFCQLLLDRTGASMRYAGFHQKTFRNLRTSARQVGLKRRTNGTSRLKRGCVRYTLCMRFLALESGIQSTVTGTTTLVTCRGRTRRRHFVGSLSLVVSRICPVIKKIIII